MADGVAGRAILKGMRAKALQPTATHLYDLDFFEWTVRNAELLRAGRFQDADIERIAEELEDMGKHERRELFSRTRVLLTHLLKWQIQPERQSRSWRVTISTQRQDLEEVLEEMPSLRGPLSDNLPRIYRRAAANATEGMGLFRTPFPETCPFTQEQILDTAFFPE